MPSMFVRLSVAAVAALLSAAPAAAQQREVSPSATAPAAVPTVLAGRAGAGAPMASPLSRWHGPSVVSATPAPVTAVAPGGPTGREKGLMIVGGAALVAGAVVGGTAGTLVSLGGAAVALYGLYLYASR